MVIKIENIFEKYQKDFLEYMEKEGNIEIAYLFYYYANNTYNASSDIDIAVIYKVERRRRQ